MGILVSKYKKFIIEFDNCKNYNNYKNYNNCNTYTNCNNYINMDYCTDCDIIIFNTYFIYHCKLCNVCHYKNKLYCNECNKCYDPLNDKDLILHRKICIIYNM